MADKVDREELKRMTGEAVQRERAADRPLRAAAVKSRVTKELRKRNLSAKQTDVRRSVEESIHQDLRLRRFTAGIRWARISPRKVRRVTDLLRGKDVNTADALLKTLAPRGAALQKKLVSSAIANATYLTGTERADLDVNKLRIVEAKVDPGPIMYRARPSSERHPYRIRKRFCHIWITVEEREPLLPKKERGKKSEAAPKEKHSTSKKGAPPKGGKAAEVKEAAPKTKPEKKSRTGKGKGAESPGAAKEKKTEARKKTGRTKKGASKSGKKKKDDKE